MAIEDSARTEESATVEEGGGYRWYQKVGALIYVFFCFEIGIFLVLFPWLDLWQNNVLWSLAPAWGEVLQSPYVRGAVSGIGVLDIGISFSELFRLRRFAKGASSDRIQ